MDPHHDLPLDATLPHGTPTPRPATGAALDALGSDLEATIARVPSDVAALLSRTAAVGAPAGSASAAGENRFELLGVLGEGGMGKVYRARDLQIEGRSVALKVLHPQYSGDPHFRELFFQEIRAAQGFVSEHVVQVRDTGHMPDGSLFLTMDLVPGESLRHMLRRECALTPRHAFKIARQMLLGLQGGHERGLVHRDIKPSNVMLAARVPKTSQNPFGVGVRLLDFGIAGLAADDQGGQRTGTPMYMSPEQVQAQRLDARSDLFAVGVVLYEMIAGARPFEGETLEQITTSILETQIEPLIRELGDLPRPVRKLLRKALRKDRERRFQSAGQFLQALERVKQPEGGAGFLTRVALATFAIGAGIEGMYIVKQRQGIAEHGAALDDAVRRATDSKTAELASLNLRMTEREAELRRLQERRSDDGDMTTRFEDLERDYSEQRDANATLQRLNEDLNRQVTTLRNVRFENLPGTKTAACFDEALRRIDHGAGAAALDYLEAQAKQGIFAVVGLDGRNLVFDLAQAAAALEAARKANGVDLPQLSAAQVYLAGARKAREDFALEARSWINVALGGGDVDRLGALDATLTRLENALAALREHGATSQEFAKQEVEAGPANQDPEAAFAHAAMYGAQAITGLIGRYAAYLEENALDDGWLRVARLRASEPLEKWGFWLGSVGANVEGTAADTIRAFYCARRWYAERDATPPFAELFAEVPDLTERAPHHDWRAQLALQFALSEQRAYPLPSECSAVMRHTWTRSRLTMWFLERLKSHTPDGWQLERRIHDAAGEATGRPQTYSVTRLDDAFFTAGTKGLDLRSAERGVRTAYWTPQPSTLPDKPWVRGLSLALYTREVEAESVPCLVVQAGEVELWFSPRLGLVRETRAGIYQREQVFFNAR